jgi:hypothetical protein
VVTEHAAHVGHFWSQLGELLREAEKPHPAEAAGVQQAYRELGREDAAAAETGA